MMANIQISKRFIDAYYQLYSLRVVKSRAEYCASVNMHPANFKPIQDGKRYATVESIYRLCRIYNISADWILFGEGDLFAPKKSEKAIVSFSGIIEKAIDRYSYNKSFSPEKLTDENLEKCVMFYSEKLRKNKINTK